MWLPAVELALAVTLVVMAITQIILPLGRGEPLLPLLWSKEKRLQVKEKRLRQQIFEHHLEEEVEELEQTKKQQQQEDTKCHQPE